ncbi:MAG: sialidase family protein [Phycisphaerae bacterium]
MACAATGETPGGASALHEKDRPVFVSRGGVFYRLPSLLVTKDGTVLAACQKRLGHRGDWARSALVLRRSTDGGRTWSDEQVLFERADWCCFNGNLVEDRRRGTVLALFIAFPRAAGPTWFPRQWMPAGGGFDSVRSTDDGKTWSEPTHHVPAPNPDGWRGGAANNNNHGFQLSTGPHAGRLVVGARVFKKGVYEGRAKGGVIYSDDGGKIWHVGGAGLAGKGAVNGEVALCEAAGGEVYVSYRNRDRAAEPRRRFYSRSRDGGATFYDEGAVNDLSAHGCNAGLVGFTPRGADGRVLLLTYPARADRADLTAYLSRDGGRSWTRTRRITGHGGYSDVTVLPDGTILALYEAARAGGLYFARFNLAWIER